MKRHQWLAAALVAFLTLALTGCDESPWEYSQTRPPLSFQITSTIPMDRTHHFPRSGAVVFHYNREIDPASVKGALSLERATSEGNWVDVPFRANAVGANIYLKPLTNFLPDSQYRVTVKKPVQSTRGDEAFDEKGEKTLTFFTEPVRAQAGQRPELVAIKPDPKIDFVPDSVTFQLLFSEPLDESMANYGSSIKILGENNDLVPAKVFARNSKIVIDPDGDLAPDADYRLSLTGLTDRNGESLQEDVEIEFSVTATSPRSLLPVVMCPTLGEYSTAECPPVSDEAQMPPSPYTGDLSNSMVIDSTLLGRAADYVSGRLVSEIGNPKLSEDFVPIVIRKGQKIYGNNLKALLGGQIETGEETGDLVITVLTDTNGFLAGSDVLFGVEGAEAGLVLTMDAAINTTNPDSSATNAMMAQSILGVELIGMAYVSQGKMIMEVAGFTEMELQGETLGATMAMRMISMDVADPEIPVDTTPPVLRSTDPVINQQNVRLANRVVAVFDEPLDPATVRENISLQTLSGAKIAGRVETLGSRAVLTPLSELSPVTNYQIVIEEGLADLSGNPFKSTQAVRFRTGPTESSESEDNPPLLTTVHPGPYDWLDVPAHFPIIVTFNQLMDENTIRLGDTFQVLDLTDGWLDVPGTLYFRGSFFVFEPNEFWKPGHTYRMILSDEIANVHGLFLDLNADRTPGGDPENPEWFLDFRAMQENRWVLLMLALDPLVDADGSGYIDGNETGGDLNTMTMKFPGLKEPSYASGYMITWLKGLETDEYGVPYMNVDVNDGTFLSGTSVSMELFKDTPNGLFDPMGRIAIDVIKTGSADITANSSGQALMNIQLQTYFDMENATYRQIINHDLNLKSKGLLSFSDSGRMVAGITGSVKIKGKLHIPILGWDIPLIIPTQLDLQAAGEALPYY